jgi:hypothetical protein
MSREIRITVYKNEYKNNNKKFQSQRKTCRLHSLITQPL